jgi:hypothetical protein
MWRGDLDLAQAASRLIAGRLDAALLRAAEYASGAEDEGQPTPALFNLTSDGQARVRYVVRRGPRVVLEVRGERISTQTAAYFDRLPGSGE